MYTAAHNSHNSRSCWYNHYCAATLCHKLLLPDKKDNNRCRPETSTIHN
jgi:hypothetical protein